MKNSNSYEPLQWKLWSLFEVMTCPMLTFFSSLGGVVPWVCLQWGYSSVPNRGVGTFIKFDEKFSDFPGTHDLYFSLFINACLFIWSCTSIWYTRVDGFALIFLESLKLLNCTRSIVYKIITYFQANSWCNFATNFWIKVKKRKKKKNWA